MLRKLMKYELIATGRIMLPMFVVVLLTAVGANISARIILHSENFLAAQMAGLFMTAFIVSIIAVCVAAFILMIYRFYKNLLQDEGYVMMTLPVSVHQQVLCKALTSFLWYVATALVLCGAFFILMFDTGILKEFYHSGMVLVYLFTENMTMPDVMIGIEAIVLAIIGGIAGCLEIYAALAIGHSFPRHKLLMSVVVFFAMQLVLQFAGGSSIVALGLFGFENQTFIQETMTGASAIHITMLLSLLLSLAVAVVFYFITIYFLKKRLNLE